MDPETETPKLERVKTASDEAPSPARSRKFDLDAIWPAIPGGSWPPGFDARREQIYDECGRLTGGPQDEAEPHR